MKLNITVPPKTPPKPVIATRSGWESPVGWWNVTTEGDCEGRTTDDLGTFYGHVAEIALSLKCHGYSLQFSPRPDMPVPAEVPTYVCIQTKGVHVALNIGSKTWDMAGDRRAKHFTEWFDTDDVVVRPGQYYASVFVVLAKHLKAVELAELREKRAQEERDREWQRQRDDKEARRQRALAKLTDEDKAALGVGD
jgi:hypothetical protein